MSPVLLLSLFATILLFISRGANWVRETIGFANNKLPLKAQLGHTLLSFSKKDIGFQKTYCRVWIICCGHSIVADSICKHLFQRKHVIANWPNAPQNSFLDCFHPHKINCLLESEIPTESSIFSNQPDRFWVCKNWSRLIFTPLE